MKTLTRHLACSLAALALTASVSASDTKIEQAIRDLDAQWSKAAEAKDAEKAASYYSADAVVMPANSPAVHGQKAARELWQGLFVSGASINWKADHVEVASGGDMASCTGTYELTTAAMKDHGKYLVIWKKQADGSWKASADIWNSDLPAAAAPARKDS